MSYKAIHGLKKETKSETKTEFKRHLVVGHDLFSVALYADLIAKHGADSVFILSKRELNEEEITPLGPSMLRGKANIEALKNAFPEINLTTIERPSLFYKEMKWREFGGRAKSEKLLNAEEFFVAPRAELNMNALFPVLKDEEFLKELNERRLDYHLMEVRKVDPTDLVDRAYFSLKCANGTTIECEHLYWGLGPQELLNLYSNKSELSDDFIGFCEETRTPCALYIRLIMEKPITDQQETVFLPLSYTHEWGHFIGEFGTIDGKQTLDFVTFFEKDHSNEEEVSKKIRILKRNLEKIYEKFSTTPYTEFIKLTENSPCLKIDDSRFQRVKKQVPNLHLVSINAPLEGPSTVDNNCEDSEKCIAFLARAALSVKEISAQL